MVVLVLHAREGTLIDLTFHEHRYCARILALALNTGPIHPQGPGQSKLHPTPSFSSLILQPQPQA